MCVIWGCLWEIFHNKSSGNIFSALPSAGLEVNFLVHLQSSASMILSTSKLVRQVANFFPLFGRHGWLTRERLLVDILDIFSLADYQNHSHFVRLQVLTLSPEVNNLNVNELVVLLAETITIALLALMWAISLCLPLLGNSRKYPYHRVDCFHILIHQPPSLPPRLHC